MVNGELKNKACIWLSNDIWSINTEGEFFYIQNISKNTVLGLSQQTVINEEYLEDNPFQLWKKGKADTEGYFTLENSERSQVLTAKNTNQLEIEGKMNFYFFAFLCKSIFHIDQIAWRNCAVHVFLCKFYPDFTLFKNSLYPNLDKILDKVG